MESNKQFLGMAAALTANLIFGLSFIFSKLALSVTQPLIILAVRFTVAFLALNILMLTGAVKINLKGKPKKKLIAMGVAQPLLYFILELYGLSLVSSALSGIIIALVPVGVIIISGFFLKEKPTKLQICCTVLSILGISVISIISDDGGKSRILGIFLLLGAVIAAAVFNILSRSESERFSPFERTYIMFLIGSVGFNLIAFAVHKGEYFKDLAAAFCEPRFIIAILYLAVLSSVAAFMLYNYSTSVISAVRSSSFSNIITVVSVLAGIIILKEKFSLAEVLLCIPVILGVWGVNYKKE
ncbi:MAG: DMT family transporter [Clostridia bacterium]|nr:DMT family transporter [Clostridia bacterium]